MPSTGNIFDVSARGDAAPYEGMSSPAVTRDCPNRGRDLSANSSAAITEKQRIDAEMRLIFRSSSSTTLDPADDPRFA